MLDTIVDEYTEHVDMCPNCGDTWFHFGVGECDDAAPYSYCEPCYELYSLDECEVSAWS